MTAPTIGRLRELFDYDPESGSLRWRKRFTNAINADLSAGFVNSQGYLLVMVDGKSIGGHRIAWALHHGTWPVWQIDHINGHRADNRIVNLRDVPSAENQKNTCLDRRNRSGVSGVRWRPDRRCWEVSIRQNGRLIFLGRFDDFEAATATRRNAENLYGFHPNHGRLVAGKKVER